MESVEYWDLYDKDRKPLGQTYPRGPKMPEGPYHMVADIWTVNSRNEFLLTRRSPEKETYPGCWENTGGSVLAGETMVQGAVRELLEETGIRAGEEELVLLGSIRRTGDIVDTFLLQRDIPLAELVPQAGETDSFQWVTLAELDKMIREGHVAEPVARRFGHLREHILGLLGENDVKQ